MDDDRLTTEDEASLAAALAEAGETGGVTEAIAGWAEFVDRVEGCRVEGLPEYLAALRRRDAVEAAGARLSVDGCVWLANRLAPLDARFLGTTRSIGRAIDPEVGDDAPPWWFRLPRQISASLRDGLIAAGLVAGERP